MPIKPLAFTLGLRGMVDEKIKHLQNRAGFGIRDETAGSSVDQHLRELFKKSSRSNPVRIIENPAEEFAEMGASEERRKKIFQRSKEDTLLLNAYWLSRFSSGEETLREKMNLFWHDHFACRVLVPYLAQQQNNAIREHALGSFRTLLMAVSKDPAMLQFLNNQQNKKGSPNENFAREVMELFTLGRGNYSESDIKNAARAFTGWAFNPGTGEFLFKKKVHDEGIKTFRGRTGNLTGEDVIHQILEDKQTARFVTEKIWKYFVSYTEMDEARLDDLSSKFFKSDYNIGKLLQEIYSSDWFYEKRFVGNRIKSPVELIASIQVHTNGSFVEPKDPLFIQKALGQVLFVPPNVGGWPNGEEWIDSSSLTFRMTLPAILFRQVESDVEVKDDGDVNNVLNTVRKTPIALNVNWETLASRFTKSTETETLAVMENYLLSRPTSEANKKLVASRAGKGTDPERARKIFSLFMSLPEYQLS